MDMKVTGIEKVKKDSTIYRRIRESSWIDRTDTNKMERTKGNG